MSKQSLLILQSLWAMERRQPDGVERSIDQNIAMIQEAGFDGISTSCTDPARVALIARALDGSGLAVEGMCFPQTIDHLKAAIDLARRLDVVHLDVQPDIRPRRVADCVPLLEGWIRVAQDANMPIYFETHRNRMTTDLLFTLELMDQVPEMRMLADLSHVLLGREFWYPISDEDEAQVRQVLDRTWAFHGRVASREQIQVEITFPQHKIWLDLFLYWWKYGFKSWQKARWCGCPSRFRLRTWSAALCNYRPTRQRQHRSLEGSSLTQIPRAQRVRESGKRCAAFNWRSGGHLSAKSTIVIVGAGEAGTAAAIALRERGWRGRLALVGNETILPYERPPLSKALLLDEMNPGPKLIVTSQRLAELEIEYLQGSEAVSIDRAANMVTLSNGSAIAYHRLLLATGGRPRKLSVPIAEGAEVATLRTYEDATRIRHVIGQGCDVIVIGGGFIGLEVAASAVSRGASVTVLEAGSRLLTRAVPASMAELIKAKHERSGVRIEIAAIVERIDRSEGRSKVVMADGRSRDADLVIVGVGATPNVGLAQAAGLAIEDGIALDETLATSDPHVFAAGDCCSFPHRLYEKRIRLEAWRNAQRQGAAAAANMLGENRPYEDVPWFWSDQYDETLQIVGLVPEGGIPIIRDFGARAQILFYLAADGRLVAACGFGSLGVVAREIRAAEIMIARRLRPPVDALASPEMNMKKLMG